MNLGYVGLNCILERAFGRLGRIYLKLHLRSIRRGCRGYVARLTLADSGVGRTIEFREVVQSCNISRLEVLVYSLYPEYLL